MYNIDVRIAEDKKSKFDKQAKIHNDVTYN